jgi:hypothetical protein
MWDPDSNTSPSIMLRLACGSAGGIAGASADVGLFRNDSGASFAEAAWVRGVNGAHALPYDASKYADTGGSWSPAEYRVSLDGQVRFQGVFSQFAGAPGDVFATLPASVRKATDQIFPASCLSGGVRTFCTIKIAANGDMTTDAAGGGAAVSLDGISYSLGT